MPLPDFRVRSTSRFASVNSIGPSGVNNAIRSAALGSTSAIRNPQRRLVSKASTASQENRRVVRQAMVCCGSLRVRTCKLLWKSVALQLMVTTTTSLSEDESHFDDCEDSDDSGGDDDIEKLTTMARPNKTHHYSLVFCHRSLMGHARRERIELDDPRDAVVFVLGEDGFLSTRFEFSIVYGAVGPSGRRRTLTFRARDAKEYLQWTEALRTVMECQGKNKGLTRSHTLASSKAPSNSRGSIGSFFDAEVVEEQQQLIEQQQRLEEAAWKASANAPTSPTAATAATAIAPPVAEIAEESALKPVPADIAVEYTASRRRQVSVVVNSPPRPVGTRLQRRKSPSGIAPLRRGSVSAKTVKSTASKSWNVEHVKPHHPVVTVSRPAVAGQRRRRSSAARRPSCRKISLSDGGAWRPHSPDSKSSSKRSRLYESESRPRVPSSPLAVLGELPMLSSSSLVDSPFDFIDAPSVANPRTTDLVDSLVQIAGVSSATQRQKLLQPSYRLPLRERKSEEDEWLMSRRTSRLNLDMYDIEEAKSKRSNRRGESWAAYLKAMECEL